jgi:hypothetical protein
MQSFSARTDHDYAICTNSARLLARNNQIIIDEPMKTESGERNNMKIRCDCIDKETKDQINISNLYQDLKRAFSDIRTCGQISERKVIEIVQNCKDDYIKCVINEMKKYGLTKSEIDEKILDMREKDLLRLEVGTPIGATEEELKEETISTERNRFNYAKPTRKAYDIFR